MSKAIVDTHSPEWKVFQAKRYVNVMASYHEAAPEPLPAGTWTESWESSPVQHHTCTTHSTPTPTLDGPSDAEIVEMHGWTLNEIPTPMPDGWTYEEGSPSWRDRVYSLRGHRVTRQERQAAWSREPITSRSCRCIYESS